MARPHRLLRWMERLLVVGGLGALAWCGYVLMDAGMVQRRALDTLHAAPVAVQPVLVGEAAPPAARSAPVAALTPLAELQIPRLHLSAAVLEGSDADTLRTGLGHIARTAQPGQLGNAGIAGHRDTFFRSLSGVQVGDDVFLNTPQGRSRYNVSWVRVVAPDEVSVLEPTEGQVLTLVTCYPFGFIGPAPDRFVVRAMRVDDEQASVRAAVEHFRVAYNAQLTRHGPAKSDGLVTFTACDVAMEATRAAVTCEASSSAAALPAWTFELDKIGGQWMVTSLGM